MSINNIIMMYYVSSVSDSLIIYSVLLPNNRTPTSWSSPICNCTAAARAVLQFYHLKLCILVLLLYVVVVVVVVVV